MKHSKAMYAVFGTVLAVGLLGGTTMAEAHGWGWFGGMNKLTPDELATKHQAKFQGQADLLGISVDDIKTAWAEGKTLEELAKEKGISEDQIKTRIKEKSVSNMKSQLQTLVDKNIITQTQADARLKIMQRRIENSQGYMMGKKFGFRGFHL